jgi:hypothetical protein
MGWEKVTRNVRISFKAGGHTLEQENRNRQNWTLCSFLPIPASVGQRQPTAWFLYIFSLRPCVLTEGGFQ